MSRTRLLDVHERLLTRYDVERWHWRQDTTPLDVCLGAILVQHTAWSNVEKALQALRDAGADTLESLTALPEEALAELVRSAGTPSVKARRLKAFVSLVGSEGGFEGLFRRPTSQLRELLLGTPGIGPETADVILLYAARRPVVVHDAYTARLCRRLGVGPQRDTYDAWRTWLDDGLPRELEFRWRSHAAIVLHCKNTCRVKPRCESCSLRDICDYAG